MSKTAFQSRIVIDGAYNTDGANLVWVCNTTLTDNDGTYTGYNIGIGDVVSIDTAGYEPGTFTFFTVTNIITPDASAPVLELTYSTFNDNDWGAPPLDGFIGQPSTIARPSTKLGLLPVVSTNVQGVSDKYTEYIQNYNFIRIVDNLQSGNRTFTKINGSTLPMLKGMAVYITQATPDECKPGVATSYATSCIVGLIADAMVPATVAGELSSKGMLEKPIDDWDIITGEVGGLSPGKDYFLRHDMTGGITSTPPVGENQFVVKVGKAISSTLLDVDIETPIQL